MTVLIGTDLDGTMIYPRRALSPDTPAAGAVCVEVREGAAAAFMTSAAAAGYAALAVEHLVVPATTRTSEQYRRVQLPGPVPRFAIVANGGSLYVDGTPDRAWQRQVTKTLTGSVSLGEMWAQLAGSCDPTWTKKLRNADGLFIYAVIYPRRLPAGFIDDVTGWAAERGWCTSLQGRKLYWVPEQLTKAAAFGELARRVEADYLLAAGDSLLDADLLLRADRAIHPRHGELFEQGWSAPSVERTPTSGALAGEQIVRWFAKLASAS